jgi:flagellar biosynthesis/type III secretory pathway M-ring protein FliF/YscJ
VLQAEPAGEFERRAELVGSGLCGCSGGSEMKGGIIMHRRLMVAVLIVMLALATGLVRPVSVQAGAPDAEKDKLIELMKAQMAMQRGEHEMLHQIMDQLLKKYPNDPEIKALDEFHEKWHSRAKMQEEMQQRTQMILSQP